MSEKDTKIIVDISKFSFDQDGKYELVEIVDPNFLEQIGGGGGIDLPIDINVSATCGDQNTGAQCGADVNFWNCNTNTTCPTNESCPTNTCGEDGDDE